MNYIPPVCSCRNGGKPWEQDGVAYVSLDPACRVHQPIYSVPYVPISAEAVYAHWEGREKEK